MPSCTQLHIGARNQIDECVKGEYGNGEDVIRVLQVFPSCHPEWENMESVENTENVEKMENINQMTWNTLLMIQNNIFVTQMTRLTFVYLSYFISPEKT